MAISNQLQVSFSHNFIDKLYDFYLITTSDKYISGGAYLLDKPVDSLKAESVVFDNGRSLFLMFRKNTINRFELINQLIEQKLTFKQVNSSDIKDYILFRLFLYSISNFDSDDNRFNNVAGKLYITKPKWMAKSKKTFKALNINVDDNLCFIAEATTFTQCSLFTSKKTLNEYPRYTFSNKNGALKRTFNSDLSCSYIRKSIFGKKAEICFFDFSKKNIEDNKVFFIYKTIALVKSKFEQCLAVAFRDINIAKSIGKYRENDFIERCVSLLKNKTLNVINWSNSPEFTEEFNAILALLSNKNIFDIRSSDKIEKKTLNLVYLHNKEYYEQNDYNDPYKNFDADTVIQHITIEDCADKLINDNEAIFNAILKEFVIKQDIINNKKITIDNWSSFSFNERMIFGKEKDEVHYFLVVNPDGSFEFKQKSNDFSSFKDSLLDKCSAYLSDNKGKEKSIVASKENILMISRSGKYILPSEGLLTMKEISRSKESRDAYLSGVVDINLFNDNDCLQFNAGIQGSGMKTVIPKASILYSIDIIEGKNVIDEILETMAVSFVKYKNFTVTPYPFKYLNEYILYAEQRANIKQ